MDILIRAIIGVIVVWFTQLILGELAIKEPANKVIFLVVLFLAVLFIVFGNTVLPIK
jgi:hypothetical protein